MIDKNWAENCLRHNRNSAIISLASMQLLNSDIVETLRGKTIIINEKDVIFNPIEEDFKFFKYRIELDQIIDEYYNHNSRFRETLDEFFKNIRRSLIKESFEVIKAYASAFDCNNSLKGQAWYQFSRIIRNAISHDFHFNFNKSDLKVLPVNFGGIQIDSSLNNQYMKSNHLPPGLTWDLYSHFVKFLNSH